MKFVNVLNAIVVVLALSACTPKIPVQTTPIIAQEALLQPCSYDTPIPTGTDGEALYKAFTAYQGMYGECALRLDKLIETIRKLNNTTEIKTR